MMFYSMAESIHKVIFLLHIITHYDLMFRCSDVIVIQCVNYNAYEVYILYIGMYIQTAIYMFWGLYILRHQCISQQIAIEVS